MMDWIWRRRTIEIGGVEPLVVDKILIRYIEIGSVEPLVIDILSFLVVRGELLWGKVSIISLEMNQKYCRRQLTTRL